MHRHLFNFGAWIYDLITDQGIWTRHIERTLEHAGDRGPIRRVLDLGCGPGISGSVLARRLPRAQILGVDVAERMIERAKRHQRGRDADLDNLSFEVGDASDLRFPDGHFDLALGHSFLYLVTDPVAVLRETARVLRPGGRVVLLEPNRAGNLVGALPDGMRHLSGVARRPWQAARFALSMILWRVVSVSVGQLSRERIEHLFAQAGFVDVQVVESLGGLGIVCRGEVPQPPATAST